MLVAPKWAWNPVACASIHTPASMLLVRTAQRAQQLLPMVHRRTGARRKRCRHNCLQGQMFRAPTPATGCLSSAQGKHLGLGPEGPAIQQHSLAAAAAASH